METPRSKFYQAGWWAVMHDLATLGDGISREFYTESRWDNVQRFLAFHAEGEEKEYAEGMAAALRLYDKTGHIPTEDCQ